MLGEMAASLDDVERVYRSRGTDFFRFAFARTGDRESAHDAVQEGFARAIKGLRSFHGGGSLEAWIARCVLNAAYDIAWRTRSGVVEFDVDGLAGGVSPAEDAASSRIEETRRALNALPHRQREALFLRFYLDLSYEEIASVIGASPGTVSATLNHARASFRRALGTAYKEEAS
jgi:RNA polymerase sigma factor (sigma-70 family)